VARKVKDLSGIAGQNSFKVATGSLEMLFIKGVVSSIFSITVKSQETHFYPWKPKNNGPVALKWVFHCMETMINMSG